MMIGNYTFHANDSVIYTVVPERNHRFENGYNGKNIINSNDCMNNTFDCSRIYQGQTEFTRVDDYDPSKFPPPGGDIGVSFVVYSVINTSKLSA